jgi:single-stranded-DNA-specific exonuclease
VVPGGALTLGLAEELERLGPFGAGNPQPSLLVPGAQVEQVAGMGEERQHARFTLVTAGGARSRGVAFGTPPSSLAPAAGAAHDLVLRLERNRWNGIEEPRIVLRAMCPTAAGSVRALGEHEPFWSRVARLLAGADDPPAPAAPALVVDRRGSGFAGVLGDLLTSGEQVLVAVADVPRRRASLEALVAGLAPDGLTVASWAALAHDPALASGFAHVVALDPPPGAAADPLLGLAESAHLAWGPAEVEFALAVWRAELDLRPALAESFRALRRLGAGATPEAIEVALRGGGRYPRSAEQCARVLAVLRELSLVELALDPPSCRVLEGTRTDLELSPVYRASRERYAEIERRLAAERSAPRHAAAAAS